MKFKKIFSLILCMALLISILPNVYAEAKTDAVYKVKHGDYITFGKYQGQPIEWIVVDKQEEGIYLLSKNVLTFKAFDAAENGNYGKGKTDTEKYGSSNWEKSTLREWLNSSDETVKYSTMAPKESAVEIKTTAYDKEKGFLNEFTESEIKSITPIIHLNVKDKVFIPEYIEIRKIQDNLINIKAIPTEKAVDTANIKDLSSKTPCDYWTRTSCSGNTYKHYYLNKFKNEYVLEESDSSMLYITYNSKCSNGVWYNTYAKGLDKYLKYNKQNCASPLGVRPMICVKNNTLLIGGNGTIKNPYKIKSAPKTEDKSTTTKIQNVILEGITIETKNEKFEDVKLTIPVESLEKILGENLKWNDRTKKIEVIED